MDIIVKTHGRQAEVVTAEGDATVEDVIAKAGASGSVYAAESDAPLEATATLGSQGVGHGATLVITECRRVDVVVEFNNERKTHDFAPGVTLAAVLAWATGPHGFGVPGAQRPKHTFTACDGTQELDKTDHLVEHAEACQACFKLVPVQRFEG